jgi:hypothetical protein
MLNYSHQEVFKTTKKNWVAWGTWELIHVAQENWALWKIPKKCFARCLNFFRSSGIFMLLKDFGQIIHVEFFSIFKILGTLKILMIEKIQ